MNTLRKGYGAGKLIAVLFEDDSSREEFPFLSGCSNYPNFKILRRINKDIYLDIKTQNPDLLFLDLSVNSKSLFEKVKIIRSAKETAKIILLVDFVCEHIFWIAEKLEMDGIIKKSISPDIFAEKVISVMNSSKFHKFRDIEILIDYNQINYILSGTEKKVFTLIGEGLTTQEIAGLLFVSHRTVDNHRANILKKLNLKSASKLIYVAAVYNFFLLL